MWFKRDWELIDKTVLSSGYEQMTDRMPEGVYLNHVDGGDGTAFRRTIILTFKCKLTGRVKVVKESGS